MRNFLAASARTARSPAPVFVSPLLVVAFVSSATEAADDSANPADQLQTVVVTAQKRTELLKDVPINISVLSGEQLQQQQIVTLDDLARSTPDVANTGATGGTSPGQGNYEIRGVSGAGTFTAVGQATVGTYLDDVSTTVPTGADIGSTELRLFDLDRVEVLRGPQGTLYGAASMGGTIRFITNQPDLQNFGGSVLGDVSDTKNGGVNYVTQGVLNLPLSPGTLALRLGAQYSDQSGWIDVENPYQTGQIVHKGLNDDSVTTARVSVKYQSSDSDLTILPAVYLMRETFGGDSQYDPDSPPLEIPLFIYPRSFENVVIPSLTIEKTLFGATLTSATSYFQRESDHNVDGTEELQASISPSVLWPTDFSLPTNVHQYSEELRLTSPSMKESGLPISWVAGVYLAEQRVDIYASTPIINPNGYYQALDNAGLGGLAQLLETYPSGNLFTQHTHYWEGQNSLFGELNYSPIARLTLTAGLRELVSHEAVTEYVGGFFQYFGPNQGTTVLPGQEHTSHLSPKLALRYELSDTASVYANAAQGFRLGGVNGPVPASAPGCQLDLHQIGLTSAPLAYGADSLWNYEIGTKSSFLENRVYVDAAAYYIIWKNVQQGITLPGTALEPCGSAFVTNAGTAKSDGVDLDLQIKVAPYLTVSVGGNVTHAIITDAAPFSGTMDGSHLLGVPEYMATLGLNYSAPITSKLSDFVLVNMSRNGLSYGVFTPSSPAYYFPPYTLVNSRAGVTYGNTQVSLFVKNLFNNRTDIQPGQFPFLTPNGSVFFTATPPMPRTVGMTVSIKF
jgi:iron complex outermembrane recepter protein